MGFLESIRTVYSKYFDFNGRARRSEYWFFYLYYILVLIALVMIETAIESPPILTGIFLLVNFIPQLSASIRRLHDSGKSGWLILVGLLPFGGLVLLIFYVLDSEPGDNDYGPNPKTLTDPTIFA